MIDSYKFCFMIEKLDLLDKISTFSFISSSCLIKLLIIPFFKMRQNNTEE